VSDKPSGINGRNAKGRYGRVNIDKLPKGDRVINMDGMKFQVGQSVAEELLEVLTRSLRPNAGYSIFDKIMLELDPVLDRLKAKEPAEDGRDPGRAEAYTMMLAIVRNPYDPDYAEEQKTQMERWRKRNEEGHTA
jgi:hypothetical protein